MWRHQDLWPTYFYFHSKGTLLSFMALVSLCTAFLRGWCIVYRLVPYSRLGYFTLHLATRLIKRHLGRALRRLSVVFNTAERCVIAHKLVVTFVLCSLPFFSYIFVSISSFFVTHSAGKCANVLLNICSGFTLNIVEVPPQTAVSWTPPTAGNCPNITSEISHRCDKHGWKVS